MAFQMYYCFLIVLEIILIGYQVAGDWRFRSVPIQPKPEDEMLGDQTSRSGGIFSIDPNIPRFYGRRHGRTGFQWPRNGRTNVGAFQRSRQQILTTNNGH